MTAPTAVDRRNLRAERTRTALGARSILRAMLAALLEEGR